MHFTGSLLDVKEIIQNGGLLMIGSVVFAESGLLVGFFLPGDTLLFTAGFFAAQGQLSLITLLAILIFAAVIGDNVGYSFGRQMGQRIFKKKDGILFRQEHLIRAEKFYEKHGGKTIILARFMPIIRTFAPVVAGAAKMSREKFILYNIVGASVWCVGVTLAGYWLGAKIPNIDAYITPIIIGVMILSFGPTFWNIFGDPMTRNKLRIALSANLRKILRRFNLNKKVDL